MFCGGPVSSSAFAELGHLLCEVRLFETLLFLGSFPLLLDLPALGTGGLVLALSFCGDSPISSERARLAAGGESILVLLSHPGRLLAASSLLILLSLMWLVADTTSSHAYPSASGRIDCH